MYAFYTILLLEDGLLKYMYIYNKQLKWPCLRIWDILKLLKLNDENMILIIYTSMVHIHTISYNLQATSLVALLLMIGITICEWI